MPMVYAITSDGIAASGHYSRITPGRMALVEYSQVRLLMHADEGVPGRIGPGRQCMRGQRPPPYSA